MSQAQIEKLIILGVGADNAAILVNNDLELPAKIKLASQADLEDLNISSQDAEAIKTLFPSPQE